MTSKMMTFRITDPRLSGSEVKEIIIHPELFVLMNNVIRQTKPVSELGLYLNYHPKLKRVLEKWTSGVAV